MKPGPIQFQSEAPTYVLRWYAAAGLYLITVLGKCAAWGIGIGLAIQLVNRIGGPNP